MRSVLFTIPLDARIELGPLGSVPVFGTGLLLALWCLLGLVAVVLHLRHSAARSIGVLPVVVWPVVALAIVKAGDFKSLPIYGFGTMLFLGFLSAAAIAARRLRREGADGEIAWDAAMWVFFTGILGGRLLYVIQYSDRFFGPNLDGSSRTFLQVLLALANLPDGGLVLYGSVLIAPAAYWLFCRWRGVSPLAFADVAITSVFVGLAFGRMGCLLHGCCYGDVCSLPWAIRFPLDSVPYKVLVERGYLAHDALQSLPLHPTQLYDSINALLLVILTWTCYPFRRRSGEILAIGWIAYPINRFLIEFLRSDESGKFGTPLTISQWGSIALLAAGIAFLGWLETRPSGVEPITRATPGGS